ncbi:hypothetical protein PInf_020292 [Phytophthora infestans]|nr:hypothetical protein PInf_020292 [Phytophthora infestans]
MADTSAGRKRKHDEPSGARKRRCGSASVDGAHEKTTTRLGGVAALKDVWVALTKAGWTSKKPTAKSLDTHYKYILPGRRHDGEDGKPSSMEVALMRWPARQTAAGMAELQLGADDIDVIETSGDVAVGVDEAACLETAFKLQAEVCDGVDSGGAAGHTAVAGRSWIAVGVVAVVGEVEMRGVVDLEEVVEGRRRVELRARPLQKPIWMAVSLEMMSAWTPIVITLSLKHPKRVLKQASLRRHHVHPLIMLQDGYVSKLVALSPDKEKWVKAKAHRSIGTAYINGRVYRQVKKGKNASLFQIRRLDSQFQSAVKQISNPDWRILVRPDLAVEIDFEEEESDCEEEEHESGSTQTYLHPEFWHLFEHSASSSFFDYIPLYFWRQVLHETNTCAVVNNIPLHAGHAKAVT